MTKAIKVGWLGWLVLILWYCSCTAAPSCKPQGLLMLDEPYPPPYRVSLPFCEKYHCSCCNASHALTIQRAVRPVMLDEELSMSCKSALVMLACRICDPHVGVGNVSTVCTSTCNQVFQACAEDYFAYDASTGLVTPCASQVDGQVVCSQLSELVKSGTEMCQAAGYTPATSGSLRGSCFDGTPVSPQQCEAAPPRRSSSSSSSKRPSKSSSSASGLWGVWPFRTLKRRHRRMLLEAAQMVAGALASAVIAFGVVLLLQRVMQLAVTASLLLLSCSLCLHHLRPVYQGKHLHRQQKLEQLLGPQQQGVGVRDLDQQQQQQRRDRTQQEHATSLRRGDEHAELVDKAEE